MLLFSLLLSLGFCSFVGHPHYDFGRLKTIDKVLFNGEVTLEAWVKLEGQPSGNQILVAIENCMQMGLAGGDVLNVNLKSGGFIIDAAPPWDSDWSIKPDGKWWWVASSANALVGGASLFMESVALENQQHESECYGAREVQIGFGSGLANDFLKHNNKLANVRAWRRFLDATTLMSVYNKQFPPSALPCDVLSVWRLQQATAGDATQAALIDDRQRFRLTEKYVKKAKGIDPDCDPFAGCTVCPWPAVISLDEPALSLVGSHQWQTTGCPPFGGSLSPPPTYMPSPSPTDAPTKQPSAGAGSACAARSTCGDCMSDGQCQYCDIHQVGWVCQDHDHGFSCHSTQDQTVLPGEDCPTPAPTPLSWLPPPPPTCQKPTPMPPTLSPTPAVSAGEEPWKGAASGELWREDGEEGEIAGVNSTVFIVLLVVAAVLMIAALLALVIFFVYWSRRRGRHVQQQQSQQPAWRGRSRASTLRRSTHSSLHRASRTSRSYRSSDVINTPAYI